MAWLNLGDWQRAEQKQQWRQRYQTLATLGLLNLGCALVINLPLYQQLFAEQLDLTQTSVTQRLQARQSALSQITQQQQAALINQRQVNQLKQLITLGESDMLGLRLNQARWTATQLSLYGDYVHTERLTQLAESLKQDGQQRVQLQLQPQQRAQIDLYKP